MSKSLFGVIDWDSPTLTKEYYPPDLPKDWRLDYYANEYGVVVVPQAKWLDASEDDFEEWLDGAGDELFFLFEVEDMADDQTISRLKSAFSDQFLGVVSKENGNLLNEKSVLASNHSICVFYIQSQNESKSYLKDLRIAFEQALPKCKAAQKRVFVVYGEHSLTETLASVQILLDLMGEAY